MLTKNEYYDLGVLFNGMALGAYLCILYYAPIMTRLQLIFFPIFGVALFVFGYTLIIKSEELKE